MTMTNNTPYLPAAARRSAGAASLAIGALMLAGCATGPDANPRDPLEPYNRTMTRFNDQVDRAVFKPVATAYRDTVPSPVRTGVSNFFSNLNDVWSFVNNVLQLKGSEAMDSLVRFNVNTVFGLGGVLDIASEMGIPRRRTDFGLTLGSYGVPTGPYLVLPLLGPSTVRDTVALPVDARGNVLQVVDPVSARNQLYALRLVDTRANLLSAGNVLETAALDRYSFTRDVYLRVRGQDVEPFGSNGGSAGSNGGGRSGSDDDYDPDAGMLPPEPN
ncbi:VacJ family lipoprotein [Acidovorax sp. Leaf160]|uniref:MlaA family lipoprotein n=1 Tax=Acidovorax sp. Leaf160 TaxID=1736280 RepID=UPI0006F41DA0|nr:ABC transporter [Acidovorax sp. Leaf160]